MFLRVGKHVRPLACMLNRRPMSWKRNLPISFPFDSRSPWSDTWREARDMERRFENMWRDMDRVMGPRFFEQYFDRARDLEVGSGVSKVRYLISQSITLE